ncbi:hypothetical protein ABMY20_12735 [Tenacibaculum sp. SSH1-16]|uniref:hypothetical protein n=1 Tax=Tenacibaculum sp. SSH1-16 TaxID=3136667 RepID=UPI0032C42BC3
MTQDAINSISKLLEMYSDATGLEIYSSRKVTLCYNDPITKNPKKQSFEGDYVAIPLVEWMEENLSEA